MRISDWSSDVCSSDLEVERRAGFPLRPARPFAFDHNGDRFGWVEGEDGRVHLTLRIPAGRIVDGALDGRGDAVRHLSGLRAIAGALLAGDGDAVFRMTPNQNLVIDRKSTRLNSSH